MSEKTVTEEIQYLGQMLTATTESDKQRLISIVGRLNQLVGCRELQTCSEVAKIEELKAENEKLKGLLSQAISEICSFNCPSIKKTGEEWSHCKLCEDMTIALKGYEK